MIILADRSTELNPDFLSEVVLYALSVADLTMLLALVFVLARNVVKLVVERRRGLPFSRFRAKLVLALLGLTIVPSVLVLIVGGELIRSSTERWFSQPIDDVLRRPTRSRWTTTAIARRSWPSTPSASPGSCRPLAVEAGDIDAVRSALAPEVTQGRVGLVEVYRLQEGAPPTAARRRRVAVAAARPRPRVARSAGGAGGRGSPDRRAHEPLDGGGELVRAGAVVREPATNRPVGVVIASDHLSGELAEHSRRITEAYEDYSQLAVLKRPLEGVYLSLFLMMTLMILVSATWMGLYLAKRITRPVQMLAAGAREIGAGHLDHRIEPETRDEFGSLVEAFNSMAGELAASQRKLERSRVDLRAEEPAARRAAPLHRNRPRAHRHRRRVDRRRRPDRHDQRRGAAPARGRRRGRRLPRRGRVRARGPPPAGGAADALHPGTAEPAAQEIALAREGRELHLAAAATPLQGEDGGVRRRGARVRRRDAAHPDAARRGLARRGAAAGARDQEPADADSALRRADAPALRRRAAGGARARRRVHDDDRRRSRVAQGAGRRVRAVRADAGAARGAVGPERAC